VLVGREKGFDVRGLLSRGADGKPNGEESCADTGERVSVADWGGVKVNPPKAGLIPEGDMCVSSGPRRSVSMLRGRIMFVSEKVGENPAGEASGVPSPWELPKGAWSACAMSKSSGRARERIMRSRSSLVRRLSLALLQVG
jgi:hypothetical protein